MRRLLTVLPAIGLALGAAMTAAQAQDIGAAKGMAWESPRGPISIDPDTRNIVQNVYIRRVEKVDGMLVNVDFDKIEAVKDPVLARMMK